MDKEQAYNALLEVAKKENLPIERIIKEIERAISAGYASCVQRNDKEGIKAWEDIPSEGPLPNAVEMIMYLDEITQGLTGKFSKPWDHFGFL